MTQTPDICRDTGKRKYLSEKAAKHAHAKAGFRIRVYQCWKCGAFHAANQDKTGRETGG